MLIAMSSVPSRSFAPRIAVLAALCSLGCYDARAPAPDCDAGLPAVPTLHAVASGCAEIVFMPAPTCDVCTRALGYPSFLARRYRVVNDTAEDRLLWVSLERATEREFAYGRLDAGGTGACAEVATAHRLDERSCFFGVRVPASTSDDFFVSDTEHAVIARLCPGDADPTSLCGR